MNGARLAVAFVLLAVPALLLPATRRTAHPKTIAYLIVVSLLAGFVLLEAALVHAFLPLAFTLLGSEELAEACRELGGHLFHASPPYAVASATLALIIGVRTVTSVLASSRLYAWLRVEAERGTRVEIDGQTTVVLPTHTGVAMALPGASPEILLSESLVVDLRQEELRAVVRHEQTHLRHHHLSLLLVGVGVGSGLWLLPWMTRAEDAVRLALERWADEEAAESPTRREHVRSAIQKLGDRGSLLVRDRLRALDLPRAVHQRSAASAWAWCLATSAIVPLGMGLGMTLIVHINRVLQTVNLLS